MKRRDFIQGSILATASSLIAAPSAIANVTDDTSSLSCQSRRLDY